MRRGDYPKTLNIGNEVYQIRFVRRFKDKHTAGECDPCDKEIRILQGLSKKETLKTLIHEVLHALQFDLKLKISHKQIYRLEKPLYRLLVDNFL